MRDAATAATRLAPAAGTCGDRRPARHTGANIHSMRQMPTAAQITLLMPTDTATASTNGWSATLGSSTQSRRLDRYEILSLTLLAETISADPSVPPGVVGRCQIARSEAETSVAAAARTAVRKFAVSEPSVS